MSPTQSSALAKTKRTRTHLDGEPEARVQKKGKAAVVDLTADIADSSDDDDDDSDPDFEYMFNNARTNVVPTTAVSTTSGSRKKITQLGLRSMFEAGKKRFNLPKPTNRDPARRTAQRAVPRPRDPELVPARWPSGVLHLADNFNPEDIIVPGMAPFQKCMCERRGDCRYDTCENARTHVYCDETCCPFGGMCGNGTANHAAVQLMRVKNTDVYALQATAPIPNGVIIGEYLGILSLQPKERNKREPNEGFRLHYHRDRDAWGSKQLCVDARLGGSLMRFLNHSCTPCAHFYEVTNAAGRIIVATACRDIEVGEEITVDYGEDLWFDCQCDLCIAKRAAKDAVKRARDEAKKQPRDCAV